MVPNKYLEYVPRSLDDKTFDPTAGETKMRAPVYIPTPEEIEISCREIQESWTAEQRHAASLGMRESGAVTFNQPRTDKRESVDYDKIPRVRGYRGRTREPVYQLSREL